MNRRDFLKQASLAAIGTSTVIRLGAAEKRVAFGGMQIECSTYGGNLSRLEDFTIRRGKAVSDVPFFSVLKGYPYPFMPTLFATAVPGPPVERKTYDAIKAEFLGRVRDLLPLDGLYLPMHGAMYVEGMLDAEGDWISAVRQVVGEKCLITASYDLHGNISRRVIDNLDMLSAFRTAPHIDREETHKRACDMLVQSLETGIRPALVWVPIPVLMPGERSSTLYDPAKRLWAQLPALNARDGVMDVSLLAGYVWADEPRATAAAVVTGTKIETLREIARQLGQQYWDARKEFSFGVPTGTMAECIERALKLDTKPVVISDSGDNPTGGGTGDRADALAELLRMKATSAVVAGIADRPATEACYKAGVGQTLPLKIGGTLDPASSKPIDVTAKVLFLAKTPRLPERQAVVQIEGVTLVLTARRRPFHLPTDFTSLGLEPTSFKIVVVKAGYLVPEIAAFANPNLMALTDGSVNQDIENLESRHRVPTYPFVQDLQWEPVTIVGARSKR
ncbi:MAG TPA: M81 family metallopeptidase [Vicinamibacterales bacterium]|nr:M81 family metallopeptidase [Vicinamibacterales bacterium]